MAQAHVTGMQRVITYQGDYTLCALCADDPKLPYALGPVSHGEHWGGCMVCGLRQELERFARLTAADTGTDIETAVRMMLDDPSEVIRAIDLTTEELAAWAAWRTQ